MLSLTPNLKFRGSKKNGGNKEMLTRKQKLKYIIYGILWLILWLFSLIWCDAVCHVLLNEPHILTFMLLVMVLFCMWEGISGLTRNIMRLQLNKTISELEKMINDGKCEG